MQGRRRTAWAVIAIGTLYLAACGDSAVAPSSVADLSATSTVVNGHSHTINVSSSDQMKPVDTTYTTSSSAGHTHTVTLTASQLTSIAAGGTLTVTTSVSATTGNHTHDFTLQGKKN
jgi:hypothetical protein